MATTRKAGSIKVSRVEYLKNPAKYAEQANRRTRVFVTNDDGEVVKVIGGHLNHKLGGLRTRPD